MRKTHLTRLGGGRGDDTAAITENIIWLSDGGVTPKSGLIFFFF